MRTYTLSGKGAEVHVRFSQTIDLANTPHEIALVSLQTAHTVTNIKEGCNDLHYAVPVDDGKGHITYELRHEITARHVHNRRR
ncbi:hypothetical protein R5R35_001713 [Gryllus longicercus]|uniref:Uncharacterized protein n=1 Tax=Gryllus longicercus TaxID=2509291 RepID=A0AAN9ZDG0_9ORTH